MDTAKKIIVACLFFILLTSQSYSVEISIPPDLPKIKYIRHQTPDAKVPVIRGKYYDTAVPATCTLSECARLFVDNHLTETTVSNEGFYHELFNRGGFEQIPQRLTLDIGSYLCGLPKYREALPLMRIMCGSTKGIEIDKAWAHHLLKCIGPDGLFYVPRTGRPWDDYIGFKQQNGAYWWQMPPDTEFYAQLPLANGRMLGTLALYYELTGDEIWNRTAKGVVDRMNEMAIKADGVAFFPKFVWLPNERLSTEQIEWYKANMWNQESGEVDRNTSLWQTWIITGLCQYYKVSKYEPAYELASGLAAYLRKTQYIDKWESHFHCVTLGIQAFLEVAEARNDMEIGAYAQKAYDHAKSGKNMIAIPEIGYFVNAKGSEPMEGCSIGDMTAIAVKLAALGLGDEYWEDVDRYTRNCLTAIQRTRPDQMQAFFDGYQKDHNLPQVSLRYYELADKIPQRTVGTFAQAFFPNEMFANSYYDTCCIGNCARAIYYVWEHILDYDKGNLKVNLLLNRTSPWADIESCIPYTGRIDIKIKKQIKNLKVRVNKWVDKDKVVCLLNGRNKSFVWDRNYVCIAKVRKNDVIQLQFPITEKTVELQSFGHKYTAVFKGNDCVDITPKGKYYTLFQRDYYRFEHPRYIFTRNFVCESQLKW